MTASQAGSWPGGRDTVRNNDSDPELPTYSREVEPGAQEIPAPQEGDIADEAAPPAYVSPTTARPPEGLPAYSEQTPTASARGSISTEGRADGEAGESRT